jgi:hypothetical protein
MAKGTQDTMEDRIVMGGVPHPPTNSDKRERVRLFFYRNNRISRDRQPAVEL